MSSKPNRFWILFLIPGGKWKRKLVVTTTFFSSQDCVTHNSHASHVISGVNLFHLRSGKRRQICITFSKNQPSFQITQELIVTKFRKKNGLMKLVYLK
jgi:hypothetical protein